MVKRKFKQIEKKVKNQIEEKEDNWELWERPARKDFKPYPAPRRYWIHCLSTSKRTSEGFNKGEMGR